jgi:hypothetical protein
MKYAQPHKILKPLQGQAANTVLMWDDFLKDGASEVMNGVAWAQSAECKVTNFRPIMSAYSIALFVYAP